MNESMHMDAERLSAYLDGDLDEGVRREVEAHLDACPRCTGVLDQIREVVRRAGELEDRPPSRDLWPAIAAAMGPDDADVVPLEVERRKRPGLHLSVVQAAAAAVVLMLASGAAGWMAHTGSAPAGPEAGASPGEVARTVAAVDEVDSVAGGYADQLARLEAAFRRSRESLDPATRVVLEKNLAVIDRAIRESRRALEAQPGNDFLKEHLSRAYRTKVEYLKEVSQVTSWSS